MVAFSLSAAACGAPATGSPAASKPSASIAPSATASASAPPPASTNDIGWKDIDAVPPGALRRLGTRALLGETVVAVSDAGVLATNHPTLGVVEMRPDHSYRHVPIDCDAIALRYAGGALFGACSSALFRWDGATVATADIDCESMDASATSARAERFACVSTHDGTPRLEVFDTLERKLLWSAVAPPNLRNLALSDDGALFASDAMSYLAAYEAGRETWRIEARLTEISYDPARSEVVGWSEGEHRFVGARATDGKPGRTLPEPDTSLEGPFVLSDDGSSWFAVAYAGRHALTRFSPTDGHSIATWPVGDYARGTSVSPNGRYAAVVDARILRVDVSSGQADPKVGDAEAIVSMASTKSGDRMLAVRAEGRLQLFDMSNGKEIASGPAPDAISRGVPVAFAPDDTAFAVANAYGDLRILETSTLHERCRLENVAATWLSWSGSRIVAVYAGNPADDEQYSGGEVVTLDTHCKVTSRREHEGLISVAKSDDANVDVLFEAYEAPPFGEHLAAPTASRKTRAVRVSFASGAIEPAPAGVLESALADEKKAAEEDGSFDTVERATSRDRRTTAVRSTKRGEDLAACFDASSNAPLSEFDPEGDDSGLEVAGDGSWMAVPDGPSIVVYPCRPH